MFLSFAMKIFPLLALFYRTITADPVCDLYGNDGCSCTYPPGHSAITSSWWAIGHRAFQATMKSVVVNLLTPPIPTDLHGAIVIIPSLENTVCLSSHYYIHLVFGFGLSECPKHIIEFEWPFRLANATSDLPDSDSSVWEKRWVRRFLRKSLQSFSRLVHVLKCIFTRWPSSRKPN